MKLCQQAPPLSDEQYDRNFSDLHPPMTKSQAVAEANRCLYCYDAPCTRSCPTQIDVATFIKKIATGNLKGSAKTIFEANRVPLTCAKACPVDVLCEGACILHNRGEKPIEIGLLQRYAIDTYFDTGAPPLFSNQPSNGISVGIVGSGPAGLSCAAELAIMGYDVTMYEASELPGGLNTWGIAPYKMSFEDSLREVRLIEQLGVRILTRMHVGTDVTFAELGKRHSAVVLAIGLGVSPAMGIPGEHLDGVIGSLEFIRAVTTRRWKEIPLGNRVAVIGGGNTAIDAATEAKRLGAKEVTILYRKGEADMPAYAYERQIARNDGIGFRDWTAPISISGRTCVESIRCISTRRTAGGVTETIPGTEITLPVDMVITAIGHRLDLEKLRAVEGLRVQSGSIVTDPETYQISNGKFFAIGDCMNGGKEVVHAAADGKRAAGAIHSYISSEHR